MSTSHDAIPSEDGKHINLSIPVRADLWLHIQLEVQLYDRIHSLVHTLGMARATESADADDWGNLVGDLARLRGEVRSIEKYATRQFVDAGGTVDRLSFLANIKKPNAQTMIKNANADTEQGKQWVTKEYDPAQPGSAPWRAYWAKRLQRAMDTNDRELMTQAVEAANEAGITITDLQASLPSPDEQKDSELLHAAIETMLYHNKFRTQNDRDRSDYLSAIDIDMRAHHVIKLYANLQRDWEDAIRNSQADRDTIKRAYQVASTILAKRKKD